jgi:hypothetical protein
MTKTSKKCKGCNLRRQFIVMTGECSFILDDVVNKCCCVECLVKVMCDCSCDERFVVIRKIAREGEVS